MSEITAFEVSINKRRGLVPNYFIINYTFRQFEDAHSALKTVQDITPETNKAAGYDLFMSDTKYYLNTRLPLKVKGHNKEIRITDPLLRYEERNKQADLYCAFGNLSLAKGDYKEALSYYNKQNNALLGKSALNSSNRINSYSRDSRPLSSCENFSTASMFLSTEKNFTIS